MKMILGSSNRRWNFPDITQRRKIQRKESLRALKQFKNSQFCLNMALFIYGCVQVDYKTKTAKLTSQKSIVDFIAPRDFNN